MVSVALLTRERGGPIPRDEWTAKEEKIASRAANRALRDVGDSSTDIMTSGDITHIVRRQCVDDERRKVLEKYSTA